MRATGVGADTQLAGNRPAGRAGAGLKAPIQRLADRVSGMFVPVVARHQRCSRSSAWWIAAGDFDAGAGSRRRGAGHRLPVRARPRDADRDHGRHRPRRAGRHPGPQRSGAGARRRSITVLAVDKTGTLTVGKPAVTDVVPSQAPRDDDVLQAGGVARAGIRASAGAGDRRRGARRRILSLAGVEGFARCPGKGVVGTIDGATLGIGSPRFSRERGVDCRPSRDRAACATQGASSWSCSQAMTSLGLYRASPTAPPDFARGGARCSEAWASKSSC